jgi:tRNA-2-methylthio-N6-dimethylallyladenosine synthase
MKVYLETMGCQMNALDSELLSALLAREGMTVVVSPKSADVLLYNTCSVRQHAEEKVHSHLGAACQRKAARADLVIGVMGCMAQRLGKELLQRHAGLDFVVGPGQVGRVVELIRQCREHPGPADDAWRVALDDSHRRTAEGLDVRRDATPAGGDGLEQDERLNLDRDPSLTHLPHQAFVRIMRGCDKFCTYCVVPFVRGGEQSRKPEAIVEEVRRLAGGGVTQVTLLGQTVNSYRWRDGDQTVGLADLLERLSPMAGLRRIRFVTSYPADFDERILQAMRDLPNVCRYLHVPAQSGSDRILKAMNRRYSRAEYDGLIDRARQIVPGISIAGDFIVGFPGETEEDHAASADLIRRSGYKNSFIFKYSPRPGTTAQRRLPDDISEAVKKRRNNELLAVQSQVSLAGNLEMIGQTVEVLVEGLSRRSAKQPGRREDGMVQLVGRTTGDQIVVFDGPAELRGEYVNVQLTAATALTLMGSQARQQSLTSNP